MVKDGAQVFSEDAWISETHSKWLSESHFNIIGQISRIPRYTNKRIVDPQLKCYADEHDIEISSEWGLTIPNEEAAYKSLAKYGKLDPALSNEQIAALNMAWSFTTKHFGIYMNESQVLSCSEAIEHLDMSTSSGAPFNQLYKTKRELFDNDPNIITWLESDWERMGVDQLWTCVFTNALKEEVRASEKLATNSLRTFLTGGVDAIVHGTRLFVDMNEKMYDSHLKSSSAVGMSPYNGDWDQLYRKLKTFRKGYALDESQYDSSLREHLMWGCARFRWGMLREEDRTDQNLNRLKVYYRNLVHSVLITPEGVLVMKKTGNPSGSVNTITDNTLILYTLMAYAWIMNSPKDMQSYESFEMNTAKALVGDDNTWTVSDVAHDFYNATSVIEAWKKVGITTTTDSLEPRTAKELDFLSAHTVFLGGKAVPIYDRKKLMNSLLYAPKTVLSPPVTLERTAAMLSVGWTDIPFRRFCRDIIAWLIKKYDRVLSEEPSWIAAKSQVQTDERYYRLFLGEKPLSLHPQSVLSREFVKLSQRDKIVMSTSITVKNGKKGPKSNAGRRGRNGARRAQVTSIQVANPGRRRARRRKNNRKLTAGGPTRTGMRAKRSCTVEEDEFIAAVNGSVSFANTSYPINPGQSATFPWLSVQASQWEKYHFNYLNFYFKHDVSPFATQGTTGKVIMGIDFDPSDAPPTTKQQIEDSDPRVDAMPCENLSLMLRSSQLHSLYPTLYVRKGGLPGSSDIKTYDAGILNVATQGCQNTTEIGELRVRYSVTFSVPVLESSTSAPALNSLVQVSMTAQTISNKTRTTLLFDGTQIGSLGLVNSAGSLILPAGNYLIASTIGINGGVSAGYSFDMNVVRGITTIGTISQAINAATLLDTANITLIYISDGTAATALSFQVYFDVIGGGTINISDSYVDILAI